MRSIYQYLNQKERRGNCCAPTGANVKNRFFGRATALLFLILSITGCKKLIDVNAPVTSTNAANVYGSDATAAAVLTGIYTNMTNNGFSNGNTLNSLSLYAGLSADEFTLYSGAGATNNYIAYYTNAQLNTTAPNLWKIVYPVIFVINSAIEGLNNATTLTPAVKQQLLGEAKFLRAFNYFYLVNLYGDVPLVLNTDYKVNGLLPRAAKSDVYKQIVDDLKDAQTLLTPNYVKSDAMTVYAPAATSERVRPNKWAAIALLARVYLYTGDYADAEAQATNVINNAALYNLAPLKSAFLKNSNEAIWQLQPITVGRNTDDAWLFIIPATGPSTSYPVYLSANLLNSFEAGDQRAVLGNWVQKVTIGTTTYYYANKYYSATLNATVTEYEMVLRLAEQYLIRAEARAQQGSNLSGAAADLNIIRSRAGLPNATASTPSTLMTAIQHERQVELFTEWGHRWLDLKRSGAVDAVMGPSCTQKGGTWNTNWQWYPIGLTELQADPNLIQNAGY